MSLIRSARVRRYAVMLVALVVVVWAVRFVLTPLPATEPGPRTHAKG